MCSNMRIRSFSDQLIVEKFSSVVGELSSWRLSDYFKLLKLAKPSGQVLPFGRGLRFSVRLIYLIREFLTHGLYADWGHLISEDGKLCSRECDIIIHKGDSKGRWNGYEKPVMDFKFINCESALLVISCKSSINVGKIDKKYCSQISNFIKRIWLFAECCGPYSIERISNKAKEHGYEKFWHLYIWMKSKDEIVNNTNGWIDFINEIKKLNP